MSGAACENTCVSALSFFIFFFYARLLVFRANCAGAPPLLVSSLSSVAEFPLDDLDYDVHDLRWS